jgi:hypothetical protein
MTLEQFKASLQTYRKSELWGIGGFLAGMIAFALPIAFVAERSREKGFDGLCWAIVVVCFPVLDFLLSFPLPGIRSGGCGRLVCCARHAKKCSSVSVRR